MIEIDVEIHKKKRVLNYFICLIKPQLRDSAFEKKLTISKSNNDK